ncbi:hypothetical protein BpHYR1_023200 [Brachionus plicatilis]|uniref:Uncharacterized protein n=1 Tax=Brachionus plicatilis TaxID=10195 RepID=A0A3M7PU62_BRAPC|nr:hypothetical protein BpHYR1_023200 [Brachionus plicatilis]
MLTKLIDNADENDNPFRPEGSLAKEADEFIKELNTKKEREVSEIIKNTSLNNSNTLSVNELMHQPNDAELARTANEPQKPAEKPDVVSLPQVTEPETRELDNPAPVEQPQTPSTTENGQKKKKKVKSKCGCIIS